MWIYFAYFGSVVGLGLIGNLKWQEGQEKKELKEMKN